VSSAKATADNDVWLKDEFAKQLPIKILKFSETLADSFKRFPGSTSYLPTVTSDSVGLNRINLLKARIASISQLTICDAWGICS